MEFMKMREKAIRRAKELGYDADAVIARAMMVHPSRVSEWANWGVVVPSGTKAPKKWKPNVWQALALAKFLRVELESLIDDDAELVPLDTDKDDRFVVRTYRTLGLTAEEAVRLLNAGVAVATGPVRRTVTQEGGPPESGRSSNRHSG